MKRKLFCLICLVIVLYLSSVPTLYAKEEIKIVTFEYPGFMQQIKIPGKGNGFGIDLVTTAFQVVNIEPVFDFQPMKRSVVSFSHGNYVAMLGSLGQFPAQDRKNLVGVLYGYGRFMLYYRKSKHSEIKYDHLNELQTYKIGSVKGSSSNRILEKAGIKPRLVTKMEQIFSMLFLGRVDMVACIELTARDIINNQYATHTEDFVAVKKPLMTLPLHIVFKIEKGKDLAEKYSKGLNIIISNGEYMKIAGKYFGSNVPPEAIIQELR
jgi:polar amino acid transport system substrate-binding protein